MAGHGARAPARPGMDHRPDSEGTLGLRMSRGKLGILLLRGPCHVISRITFRIGSRYFHPNEG